MQQTPDAIRTEIAMATERRTALANRAEEVRTALEAERQERRQALAGGGGASAADRKRSRALSEELEDLEGAIPIVEDDIGELKRRLADAERAEAEGDRDRRLAAAVAEADAAERKLRTFAEEFLPVRDRLYAALQASKRAGYEVARLQGKGPPLGQPAAVSRMWKDHPGLSAMIEALGYFAEHRPFALGEVQPARPDRAA